MPQNTAMGRIIISAFLSSEATVQIFLCKNINYKYLSEFTVLNNLYKQDELLKLKKAELDILAEIDKICKKYDIQYFAVGGTLLGAVRHSGFIPWDDDIDIGMLRDDYERFLTIAKDELPSKYMLQHYTTEASTPTYFAKVRNKNTLFYEKYAESIPMCKGIYIDIFPFDKVSDSSRENKWISFVSLFLFEIYIAKSVSVITDPIPSRQTRFFSSLRKITHLLVKPIPKNKAYHWLDMYLRKRNNSCASMISYGGKSGGRVPENKVFPLKNLPFENIIIPVPCDTDYVLTQQYGNYMQLPPEEKRYSHKPYMLKFEEE